LTLIDTSSWIEAFSRSGDFQVRERVRALLMSGEAAWCDMVRLELWNGASGHAEKETLARMEKDLPRLEIDPGVWKKACELARRARTAGLTVPSTDLLILACARHHRVAVEHCDNHFGLIEQLEKT
jgi:predicted nucleic acid-binding protein